MLLIQDYSFFLIVAIVAGKGIAISGVSSEKPTSTSGRGQDDHHNDLSQAIKK